MYILHTQQNGGLSDRNRIAVDTPVSNRIEIGRNKWRQSSI